MKKLIVSAAVALMATFANAASANWTFYSDDPSTAGLDIYLVSAVSEFTGVSDITANLIGTSGNSGKMTADEFGGATALGTVKGLSNDEAGNTLDFYYVIVSSDGKGYWTAASSAEIYTTSASPAESEVDGTALLASDYTAWKTGGGSGGGGSGGVPEPTSGLLLLVGGAMLALRRKQK